MVSLGKKTYFPLKLLYGRDCVSPVIEHPYCGYTSADRTAALVTAHPFQVLEYILYKMSTDEKFLSMKAKFCIVKCVTQDKENIFSDHLKVSM